MPVEVDALYKPLRAFFVKRFSPEAGSTVEFRFDRTPQRFADSDFELPDGSASPDLAAERLAWVADGLPLFGADGYSVELGPRLMSDLYRDVLLGPAIPYLEGVPAGHQTARIENFSRLKAEAKRRLDTARRASLLGHATFHPVEALPANWWNRADSQIWTRHEFRVEGGHQGPPKKSSSFFAMVKKALGARDASSKMTVNSVSISFEFCLVNITRRWVSQAFLDDDSWELPDESTGRYSANDGHGMSAIPVGFVAIKHLRIAAPWSRDDVATLASSDQFGPFAFDSSVADGAIGHEGLQIIGWLLQPVAKLPPADRSKGPLGLHFDDKALAQAGLTFTPPDGLPPSPASRQGRSLPFVERVDMARAHEMSARGERGVVFVSAGWSGPSRQMERVIEPLAREHRDALRFVEVDYEPVGEADRAALKITELPACYVIEGPKRVTPCLGLDAEFLIAATSSVRWGPRRPTTQELHGSFAVGFVLPLGVSNLLWIDNARLFAMREKLEKAPAPGTLVPLAHETSRALEQLRPQMARFFDLGLHLALARELPSSSLGPTRKHVLDLSAGSGISKQSLKTLLAAIARAPSPAARVEAVGYWFDNDLEISAAMKPFDRTEPLWGVPRLDRDTFESAAMRRDTLVFFSAPAFGASRDLDPLAQAMSALYAPKFQTCEVDFAQDYQFAKGLGIKAMGTFVFYRNGKEVGRSFRPSNRSQLARDIGINT
ncbi:MAG: thioredoxin domain-containing protein [Kofleriaceae bacterium]